MSLEEQTIWRRAQRLWEALRTAVKHNDMELYRAVKPIYLEALDEWYAIQQREHDAAEGIGLAG